MKQAAKPRPVVVKDTDPVTARNTRIEEKIVASTCATEGTLLSCDNDTMAAFKSSVCCSEAAYGAKQTKML